MTTARNITYSHYCSDLLINKFKEDGLKYALNVI